MILAPVLLFVYNRPFHTRKVIEALQVNEYSLQTNLIIYSDASNDPFNLEVIQTRNYLKNVGGFKSISIIERQENWGLAKNIIDGVTSIVNRYGKVIIFGR